MSLAKFMNGLRSTYGSKYGMGSRDYDRWIKIYGQPTMPQADPYGAHMAAMTKASSLYNQLGSWELVAYAWTSGLSKAMDIAENYGGRVSVAASENVRHKSGAAATKTIMGNYRSASGQMPNFAPPAPPPAPTTIIRVNIPQAPPVNAQAEVDAYVKQMSQQAGDTDAEEADPKVAAGHVVGSVMQTLSNMVRMGASSPSMEAAPSQELDPSAVESQVEE